MYKFVKNSIANITTDSLTDFKNFRLIDLNEDSVDIADVISQNEISVLYFWWTRCAPCRKFNKNYYQKYDHLKKKGIEIIGINSDQSLNIWKEVSKKDSIQWTNLYAGDKSEIISYFDIRMYPTVLIFDNKMNLLSTELTNIDELIKLLNQ